MWWLHTFFFPFSHFWDSFLQANEIHSAAYVKLFLCYRKTSQIAEKKYQKKSASKMDNMPVPFHVTNLNECDIEQYYFDKGTVPVLIIQLGWSIGSLPSPSSTKLRKCSWYESHSLKGLLADHASPLQQILDEKTLTWTVTGDLWIWRGSCAGVDVMS